MKQNKKIGIEDLDQELQVMILLGVGFFISFIIITLVFGDPLYKKDLIEFNQTLAHKYCYNETIFYNITDYNVDELNGICHPNFNAGDYSNYSWELGYDKNNHFCYNKVWKEVCVIN